MVFWKILWLSLPLAIVSFTLQTWPRWINRYFGVDVWRHIDEALYIRQHKRLNTGHQERYLIDYPSDYPPLLRIFLSFFPRSFLDEYQWAISPAFDFIHNLLLFSFLVLTTGSLPVAWLGQIIYMTSPIVILENSSLTTRPLGSLTFTAAALSMLLFRTGHGMIWLPISIVSVAILCLAHRMSLQALAALVVIVSLLEKTCWYLLIGGAGILLAVAVSGGFYLKVLTGQISMLNYWRQNIRYRFAHQIRGLPKRGEKNPDMVFRSLH